MKSRRLIAVALVALMCFALVGCGGGGDTEEVQAPSATTDKEYILIGVPNPNTGPIASLGEGTPFAEELAIKTINDDGGLYLSGYDKKLPVKIKVIDTESDVTKAGEVTQKLIVDDKVDILLARHSPDTVMPVTSMAERYGVPCVALETPIDAWEPGGPYEWSFLSFFYTTTTYKNWTSMWKEMGFGPGTVVGLLAPNEPDGNALSAVFTESLKADGYIVSDPGRFPVMNSDWSSVINQFKNDGVQVVTGISIPPDFANFAKQSISLGFDPALTTVAKAYLFDAEASALGNDIANGLTCEVWWTADHPFPSSIDGMTPREICDLYTEQTGRPWTQPIGYSYAAVELALDAISRAGVLEPVAIRDAIAATDLTTVIGPVKYNENHIAETPQVVGQWQVKDDGSLKLEIIGNYLYPFIEKTAEPILP